MSSWPETWLEFLCGVMNRMDGTLDTPFTVDLGWAKLTTGLMTSESWRRAFTLGRWGDTLIMGGAAGVGALTSGGGGGATITGVPGVEQRLFVPFLSCSELLKA